MMTTFTGTVRDVRSRDVVPLLILTAIVALLLGYTPAYATHPVGTPDRVTTDRFDGEDRFDTAGIIARDAFRTSSDVLLARGDLYPDALAGNYLAGVRGVPILLMPHDSLSNHTMDWLASLGAQNITILGGVHAISAANEGRLEARGYDVDRVAGVDRYETAKVTAEQGAREGTVGTWDGERTAVVASGENFPDALVAGGLGFSERLPVLLIHPAFLPDFTRQALENLGIERAIIPGGTEAVSQAAEFEMRFMGIETHRVAGFNRVTTATEFANFVQAEFGWGYGTINLARGDAFPDALTIGPHAGMAEAPILLTHNPDTLGSTTFTNGQQESEPWLREHACEVLALHYAGGVHAITAATAQQAETAAEDAQDCPEPEEPAVASLNLEHEGDDTNVAGDDHTVRATATDPDGGDAEDVQVRFEVTRNGAATGTPSSGTDVTDADGQATFTYTNDTEGQDTVTACTNEDGSLPDDCGSADLTDAVTKTWEIGPPATLELTPESDLNPVETTHTVNATVRDRNGNPVSDVVVRFEVTGTVADSDTDTTDASGVATFSYSSDVEGDDTITACANEDGSEPTPTCVEADIQDTASKRWEEPVASNLDLEPENATNEVGSQHIVTATVTDQFDQGVAGVMVRFEVTGTNSATVTEETDENGQATHTYTSVLTGQDTIIACMEPDGSTPTDCDGEDPGQDDNSDLQDAVTKTWESTPEQLVLDRDEATNTVGETHQTTATVTDGLGDPVEGAVVRFEVNDQLEATATTDSDGQATFSYSTTESGDDTITACTTEDGSEPDDCPTTEALTDTQTKHWQPGAPARLDLEPEESTNTVGTDHTVDVSVTDEFGNPLEGVDVRIEVRGETTETVVTTDDSGQASFTYTGPTAVQMHTIDACTDANGDAPTDCPQEPAAEDQDGDLQDAVLKWWEADDPSSLELTPATASNPVGTDHQVTATVTDQHGNPISDWGVRFEVNEEATGLPSLTADPPFGSDTTDQDGHAHFTYTNSVAITDEIVACTNDDGSVPTACALADGLSDTAIKEWT